MRLFFSTLHTKITTLPPSIDALYPHFGLNQLPLLTSPSIPPLSLTRLLAVTSSNRNPSMTRPQPIGSLRTRMTSKPKKPPPLPSLATWSKVSLTNDADNLEFWGQTTSLRRLIQTMHTTKGGGPWPRWWNAFELLKVNHRRIVIKAVKSLPRPVHQKPRPTLSLIRPPLPYHHRITSPYTNMTPLFPALLPRTVIWIKTHFARKFMLHIRADNRDFLTTSQGLSLLLRWC